MIRKTCVLLCSVILLGPTPGGRYHILAQVAEPLNFAFVNGKWFNGKSFEARTVYSVSGRYTFKKPSGVDRTLDLAGTWIVPPFGEAHNHNIWGFREDRDKESIKKYLADGVFYVKIQGNLPVTAETIHRLGINRQDSLDVAFANGALTATGGHPIRLAEELLARGAYPGYTKETLKDRRYFALDSEADLEKKWPLILSFRPDFIKTFLWCSDEFGKRRDDPAFFGRKGLDSRLLPKIVEKAHAHGLRVSTHVTNAADFHQAVAAGVDEVAHLPLAELGEVFIPIAVEDAKLAAKRGVTVVTTTAIHRRPFPFFTAEELRAFEVGRPQVREAQVTNLDLLLKSGVPLAIGTDAPQDTSVEEIRYLQGLGVFDNLTLLNMWTETTANTIFPKRKIGAVREGYEASFLALEANPLEDLQNVRRIKFRFKQGYLLEP